MAAESPLNGRVAPLFGAASGGPCASDAALRSTAPGSTFMKMKRAAFQILLAKARELSRRSGLKTMSVPGAAPVSSAMRTASVPYSSVTTSGSMTLPLVFDIFCFQRRGPVRECRPCGTEHRP